MRLIDADALGVGKADREIFTVPEYADGWNSLLDIIDNAPTVNAELIKHGHWIRHKMNNGEIHHTVCSNCWKWNTNDFDKYCVNCGAKMDLEKESENERI